LELKAQFIATLWLVADACSERAAVCGAAIAIMYFADQKLLTPTGHLAKDIALSAARETTQCFKMY
jgi:hypothetical protein